MDPVLNNDALLGIAAALAIAAYLFVKDPADAETSGGSTVSGNGFAINNPGNLRYIATNPFNGQIGNHNGYGVYNTLANGVRAMGLELNAYYNRSLTTVSAIVSTYAPASENNTAAYIADVCQRMGVTSTENLNWPGDQVPLIQAMCWHENGYNPMSDADVAGYVS